MDNLLNEGLIQDLLNDEQLQDEEGYLYEEPNVIFDFGKKNFTKGQTYLIILSSVKFALGLTLIVLRFWLYGDETISRNYKNIFDAAYLELWIYLATFHSFCAAICYLSFFLILKDKQECLQLAIDQQQVILVRVPHLLSQSAQNYFITQRVNQENEVILERIVHLGFDYSRQIKKAAEEIKKSIQKFHLSICILSKSQFALFTLLEFWGLFFAFTYTEDLKTYCQLYNAYMLFVIVIGLLQYFSVYVFSFVVLVFLPVILFYKIYECLKNYNERRRQRIRIEENFQDAVYKDGDNDCAICMCEFDGTERIVQLPCSDKHRFHTSCISSWLEVNNKCPLCRTSINF